MTRSENLALALVTLYAQVDIRSWKQRIGRYQSVGGPTASSAAIDLAGTAS